MAEKIIRMLLDDMEDAEVQADQTIQFGIDGKTYEIDLSSKNAMRLRNELDRYVTNARLISTWTPRSSIKRGQSTTNGEGSGMDTEQLRACRAWARSNGWPDLRDKGRIPRDVMNAYHGRNDNIAPVQFSASS